MVTTEVPLHWAFSVKPEMLKPASAASVAGVKKSQLV